MGNTIDSASGPRRALIVVDVQNDYFRQTGLPITYPRVEDSLPRIVRTLHLAKSAGIPVVLVQHGLPAGAPIFATGTEGWQLHPEIASFEADLIVHKHLPSVFAQTSLDDWLRSRAIDTLTIVGYMTHNCNASTVFEAFHRGYEVEVLSDASGALAYRNEAGTASAEEIHRVFSVVFHSNFAAVAATERWVAAVQRGERLARGDIIGSNRAAHA